MRSIPAASKQLQMFHNQSIALSSPVRDSQLSAARAQERKSGISHFARVVTRANEQEAASTSQQNRAAHSGFRASERSGGSGQYLPTENVNANIDDEVPNKGISLICSPSPRQQMSPYHLQHNHRAVDAKRPAQNINYEGDVLSSSNIDPVETMGGEESSGQQEDNEMFPGATRSGEQYINSYWNKKRQVQLTKSSNVDTASRHPRQHRNDGLDHQRATGAGNSTSRSQRGRWQRGTSNPPDRHLQSGPEDSEAQDDRFNPKRLHGTPMILQDNDELYESLPFGVGTGVALIAGTGSKNRESTDKGLCSEPNNNQVSRSGRTSQLGAQGSFQPNGPYYIRESQGNDESQFSGRGGTNSGKMRNYQTEKGKQGYGCLRQQYSQRQAAEDQEGEQEQISEMSDDNNYSSRSPSSRSPAGHYGDESCGERVKSNDALNTEGHANTENGEEDDEATLQERINRKHEKLRGKITQFYERDNLMKKSPPSSHQQYREQAELHKMSKQKKSGVPSRYSRHSGPLLNGLVSENSCQNLTLQQSRDSNKLEVENIQFNMLNRSSNNEFVDASNYRTEASGQHHNTVRKSDASCAGGGTFMNPADDRPIRPSSILRMFGHPEDHGLGAFAGKETGHGMPPSQRDKDKPTMGKNPLLVKKTIDLNEHDAHEISGPFQSSTSHRDSFLDSKRAKQQSMSKLNSTHAGPRLCSQQSMAQGAESSKNLESPTRCLGTAGRNTVSRVSPTKAIPRQSRSKGRDSSSSLRPMATTLYTKLLSSQNCESLTAQPRIDRIDINANQKMKKMNKNLQDKQQNRSPSALSKLGQRSQQATSKQQTTSKTMKTHAQVKKVNMEKLLPITKLQAPQLQMMQMNTDRTHQQVSTMLSLGDKNAAGAVDRQRSGALHKELDFLTKNNFVKHSGRLTGQDTLNGASTHNYLLKKASIDISSSCMTVSERSKRSLQKGKQINGSSQQVPAADMRQAQLSDQRKVYKKASSKYSIKRSPKLQSKRAAQQAGHSPQTNKIAQHTLQSMDHDTTDMEDYGSACVVVNKIKSQMMTHTEKNKFNRRVHPAGPQSRNNTHGTNAIPTALQKSRKELGQVQSNKYGGGNKAVPLQPSSCKEADKHKRERAAMNAGLQMPNTAQMLRELNVSKKSTQKAKPNNGLKTIASTTANHNTSLQHSKSNHLAANSSNHHLASATASNIKGIGQCTSLNATQKQTSNQAQRNSEKITQELQLRKKHSNNQIKGEGVNSTSSGCAPFGHSPMQFGKSPAMVSCSNKASLYTSGPTPPTIAVSSAKSSKAMINVQAKLSAQTMTPKGQKQATRLQKMQKNQLADQQATDEKDLLEDDLLPGGAGSNTFESMNTFLKAKTYKDLKEKMEQNAKQTRDSRKAHHLTMSHKASAGQQQVANNEQRKRLTTKKDSSPVKMTGAHHSGNNQDPPHFQQPRQSKVSRGSNKGTAESSIQPTRNAQIKANNQELQLDNQSHKRSILSTQASRGLNQAQNSKNQSPARPIGNRTSHIIQEDKLGLQQHLMAPGHPSPPGLTVNFGQLISINHQSYGQAQPTALTQRVSMPLNDRKNLYLSDSQMMLIDQQQTSQQSILKKNRSSKSPLMFSQRDGQAQGQSLQDQDQQPPFVVGAQFGHHSSHFNNLGFGSRSGAKDQQSAMQQKQLSNVTLSASKPGQITLQRRDRSLTDHVPASTEISNSKGVHLDREAQNSSRNPNRVRFQESLKDLQTHRSLRHANMSVTSGGGQSGGNLSHHRELTNLNHLRDQKKISKSIQRGRSIGRFGSQQSEKATEDAIGFNDINSKNDVELCRIDDRIGEKMKDIQEQLSRMNELSAERKNSTSRRRLRSNSFQRPNALENQIGTLKTSSQHSTSQRELFQQQRQQALPFQNLAPNSSTLGLRPFSAHHCRLNSMQYQTAAANAEPRQRFHRQDSLNLSQEFAHQRQAASDVKDQGLAIANLTQINPNFNFNSTTKKVMIDLSIQGGPLPSHLGPQHPSDPQQSAQSIRKFRPQMMPSFASLQPGFQQMSNGPASTGSGEFDIQNPGQPQLAGHVSTSSIGICHAVDMNHAHRLPLRASAQDHALQPLLQTMPLEAPAMDGASPTNSSPIGLGYQVNASAGPAPRINRQLSGRSTNSSPKNQFGFQPRDSKSRRRMQDTLAKQPSSHNCRPPVPHQAVTEKMSRDLLTNSVPSYQPLNTQVYPDDPLDQEKDFIIAALDNNPGYYSASGEANIKRGARQAKKAGQTSKSSLQTQKKMYDQSNNSQQNSNQKNKKDNWMMTQSQQPSGNLRLGSTPSNHGTVHHQSDAPFSSDHQVLSSQAARHEGSHDQGSGTVTLGPGPVPARRQMDPAEQQMASTSNHRVQSERYLSSAGNGSQQSLSSKKLMSKRRTAKI